jgi:hypothetical protein
MMLALALRTNAKQVYDRAVRLFSEDEITEVFAATRGLTMPTQLTQHDQSRDTTCTPSSARCFPRRYIRSGSSGGACAGVALIAWALFMALLAVGLAFANLRSPL